MPIPAINPPPMRYSNIALRPKNLRQNPHRRKTQNRVNEDLLRGTGCYRHGALERIATTGPFGNWPSGCESAGMNTPLRVTFLSVLAVGALITFRLTSASGRIDPGGTIRVQRPLMGTTWSIEVAHHGRAAAASQAIESAYDELARIDALMSEWKPASPVSQINAAAGKHAVEVPAELRAILERANRYSELSDGAFDVTWHGMASIWHFDDRFAVPTQAQVDEARRYVNFREIRIEGNRVFLPRAAMSIGLGGIAKGYAVDRASDVLARAGFIDSLVDGGGDIRVSGTRDGSPWQIGIQDP